jgi:dihydrofolate synthase/folylpolyglutamate synthase
VPLVVAPPPPVLGWSRDALRVDLPGLGPTDVGLRGRHQAANAAVADALLDALERAGVASTPPDARRIGYATASWPGRLELVTVPVPMSGDGSGRAVPGRGETREVLLDGAHNPDGAAALARALEDLRPHLEGGGETQPAPLTLVWASMADKDVAGVIAAVAATPALANAIVICTALDLPRALPAGDLAAAWRARLPGADVRTAPDPAAALDLALRTGRGPVVVAGSLYLVGAARSRLVDDPALRDPDEA